MSPFIGHGLARHEARRLRLKSSEVIFDVTGRSIARGRIEGRVGVELASDELNGVHITPEAKWLEASFERTGPVEGFIAMTLKGDAALAERLARNGNCLETSLEIGIRGQAETASVQVRLVRQIAPRLVPDVIPTDLIRGNGARTRIAQIPALCGPVSRIEVVSIPEGITGRLVESDSHSAIVDLSAEGELTSSRYYLVKLFVEFADADPILLSLMATNDGAAQDAGGGVSRVSGDPEGD